jgi:DNA-directed RNA polymerase specialized sigma24 family protein
MTINTPGTHIDVDRTLLAAARLGDERAFGKLIEHHIRGLELYCELMLGCPDRAREAVQEALLRGWRELDGVDPAASARIWLYRLATGVCLEDLDWTDELRCSCPLDGARGHDG